MKSVKASKPDVNKYFARGEAVVPHLAARRRLIVNHINKILFALLVLIYSLPLRDSASPRARIFSFLNLIQKTIDIPKFGVFIWD